MTAILNGQILVFLSRDARSWKYSIFSNCRSCGVFCVARDINYFTCTRDTWCILYSALRAFPSWLQCNIHHTIPCYNYITNHFLQLFLSTFINNNIYYMQSSTSCMHGIMIYTPIVGAIHYISLYSFPNLHHHHSDMAGRACLLRI